MQATLPLGSGLSNAEQAKLWAAADKLRGHLDAADYKHVVLGLIFLKYISDSFMEYHAKLEQRRDDGSDHHADPEDIDEYKSKGIFWVPAEARWAILQERAKQPTIGTLVDGALEALERENPSLLGVLPKRGTGGRRWISNGWVS